MRDQMREQFKRGLAVGISNIRSDSVMFRYRMEFFEFSTYDVVPKYAHYNGVFYEAKVKDLRKLEKELKNGLRS